MKNLVVAVLVVASLSLVGFLYFRTRELEDALSEERTKRVLLEKPHPDATTAASKQGDNSRTEVRANGGSTTSTAQPGTTFSSPRVSTSPSMELADRTRLDRIRAKVQERYRPLIATLGLTADGSETLLTMIALRRDAEVRAVNAAREKGEDMNGIAVKQQSATAQEELETAIRRKRAAPIPAA